MDTTNKLNQQQIAEAFKFIVDQAGTQKRLSDLLKITPQAVNKWKRQGVPVSQCPRIVQFFPSLSLSQLRPDVFDEIDGAEE